MDTSDSDSFAHGGSASKGNCLALLYQGLGVDPTAEGAKGELCMMMLADHFGLNWKHRDAERLLGDYCGWYRHYGTTPEAKDRKMQVLRSIGREEDNIWAQTPEDEDLILIQMMYHFLRVDPKDQDADEQAFRILSERVARGILEGWIAHKTNEAED